MDKKVKFGILSVLNASAFFMFLYLPFDSRYYALLAGAILITFLNWFGLGIVFEKDWFNKMALSLLPTGLYLGLGLFAVLFPDKMIYYLIFSLIFGVLIYIIFLFENIFMVAIGYKTIPLYRAAYTVSLIVTLSTAFFLFNSLFSYKFNYLINFFGIFVLLLEDNQFSIELKKKIDIQEINFLFLH